MTWLGKWTPSDFRAMAMTMKGVIEQKTPVKLTLIAVSSINNEKLIKPICITFRSWELGISHLD
jgi:hypothetical protein